MTRRLTQVWQAAALSLLIAGLAAPAFPQNAAPEGDQAQEQPTPAPAPRGGTGVRLPGGPGGPAMRRPTPPLPARPTQVSPPAATATASTPPAAQAGAASSPTAPPSKLEVSQAQGGQKMIAMEFYGLDIDHLLRLLATNAGVTIIKSPDVQGAVTIIAPDPVPLDVAFQIVNSVLAVRDYALVPAGPRLYKVVPAAIAIQTGDIPIRVGSRPEEVPASSELITQVIPLVNLSATDVASQVAGILSMNRSIIPTSTNCLILTDTATNIRRVLDIISYLEGELSGGPKVFRLQHIDATTMADLVASFVLGKGGVSSGAARPAWERRVAGGAQQGARPGPQGQQAQSVSPAGSEYAFPDTRTNSLIVQATPIHLAQIQDLVTQFDVPISLRDSYFVYPAQHVSASQLSKLIGAIVSAKSTVVQEEDSGGGRTSGTTTGIGSTTRRSRTTTSGYTSPFQSRDLRGDSTSRITPREAETAPSVEVEPLAAPSEGGRREPLMVAQAEGMMPVPALPPVPGGDGGYFGGEEVFGPSGFGSEATIVADEATNTLIITAPPEQLQAIKDMLCQLDVQAPQVYISAIIAEVAITDENSLGFQWQNLTSQYTWSNGEVTTGTFGTNFGIGSGESVSQGLSGVIVGPGDFNALLTAIGTDSHFKVLSTPSIFTSNNQPAEINVSNSTPYPVSVTVSTTGIPVTNVGYRDVGIRLLVTPRISQGGTVHMDVQVFADEPGDSVIVGGELYPGFRTRSASATVKIQNGYTVVLGGLMRDTISSSSTKVPLLGDLPLVGALFRSSTKRKEKAELLVFLTPCIVRTPAEAQLLSQQERDNLSDVPKRLLTPLGPVCPPTAPVDP